MQVIQNVQVKLGQRRKRHLPRGLHDDIHTAEALLGLLKHGLYSILVGHVRLHGDALAARVCDLVDRGVGRVLVTAVVHDDGVAVLDETFGAGAADTARPAGHDRDRDPWLVLLIR